MTDPFKEKEIYHSFDEAERNTFFSFGQALFCMPAMLRLRD
jgi:hypothetical protein